MPSEQSELAASFRHCRAVARRHARSFYFSSFALPPRKRAAAYAVYAFCRHADDTIDVACEQDCGAKAEALGRLEREFAAIMAGDHRALPFAAAFAETVERYRIPERYFGELIHGVGLDVGRVRIADWPQLRDYCYYVAAVVGLIMARVFGLDDDDRDGEARAIDLGIAMQLTNIIRDVAEDYQRDRVYLPSDELAGAGVGEAELAAPTAGAALRGLIAAQIGRARAHYRACEPGIRRLDRDGSQLTVWTMRHVYAGILDEVESADCDVLRGRAATSFGRKLRLALRAWRDCRRQPETGGA